jgi:hypothetical protein
MTEHGRSGADAPSGHSPSGLSQSSLSQAQPSVPNAVIERCEAQLLRCGETWGKYPFEGVVVSVADLRGLLAAVRPETSGDSR